MGWGVEIQTLFRPEEYEPDEVRLMIRVAERMHRGVLVLCMPPRNAT
jgi:hypothetical protein